MATTLRARPKSAPVKAVKAVAKAEDAPIEPIALTPEQRKRLLVTVDDVAWMLSIGVNKAWELVGRGEIKSVNIGRARRIPVRAVEEYVDGLMAAAS